MFSRFILAWTVAISPWLAHAEDYPLRSVKVVVPFPAGSSTDLIGREVALLLSTSLGKPFVVNNVPGGQSTVGAASIARSAPDGYSLLIGTSTSQAAAPSLIKNLSYDPSKDFAPIGRIGAVVFTLVVRTELQVKSVRELIDYGKKNPGKLNWGYANSANQVAGSAVAHEGGINATGVPYKGVPQIIIDLIGGQLDYAVIDLTNAVPHIKSGKLRALGVTSEKEIAALPGVPPLTQTMNGFQLLGWYGLFAPAGTPQAAVEILSRTLLKGLADPVVQKRIENAGLIAFPAGAEELRAYVASETVKWAKLTKNAAIQAE